MLVCVPLWESRIRRRSTNSALPSTVDRFVCGIKCSVVAVDYHSSFEDFIDHGLVYFWVDVCLFGPCAVVVLHIVGDGIGKALSWGVG